MLTEHDNVRQIEGEGFRRWFSDKGHDLIVWYTDAYQNEITGFQLCYNKEAEEERALTWQKQGGFTHSRVDSGEMPYSSKMTPVLVSDGLFDRETVLKRFLEVSGNIDPRIVKFVESKLRDYPG